MSKTAPSVSIAIFAWNEEEIIGSTLSSLFGQSIFAEFGKRGLLCEVVCVVNGCSDRTPEVASKTLAAQEMTHPYAHAFKWRVTDLKARGKLNAWNEYVHSIADRNAEILIMMDADIQIYKPHTLWNMVRALDEDPSANVSTDKPRKDILHKRRKSPSDRLSLAMSRLTGAGQGQLCGQLYAIRSKIARNIYLPRDLTVEDGFIKAMVCTDFLTHSIMPSRIRIAEEAEHVFEAYTNPRVVQKNQNRHIIAQTIDHVLIDQNLKGMSTDEKSRMGAVLSERDRRDPEWLKRLISEHLRRARLFLAALSGGHQPAAPAIVETAAVKTADLFSGRAGQFCRRGHLFSDGVACPAGRGYQLLAQSGSQWRSSDSRPTFNAGSEVELAA